MLTLEEKTNLHLRWFIGPNKNICTVIPNTDDEYEDWGLTGTHLQRMTFSDKLMDLVVFKMVGGKEVTLLENGSVSYNGSSHEVRKVVQSQQPRILPSAVNCNGIDTS